MDSSTNFYIHPDAKIGSNVEILPFSYIAGDVVIGDQCVIGPNAQILDGARLGKGVRISSGAVISGDPQDLKYEGEKTNTEIGDYTIIRECATINKGTAYSGKTVIGSNCLLMAYSHVAHDCHIGDHVILANCVNLAGHVVVEDFAILEGLAAVQQFVHIGAHAFITGGSMVRKNVPPYVKCAREPLSYVGVNTIGLKRRGFGLKTVQHIEDIYRLLFVKGYSISKALEFISEELPDTKEKSYIVNFIKGSSKGIMRGFQKSNGNTA